LTADVDGHLDYLSQLAKRLGVHDPVESYLVPVLGKWSDLHDEAGRWRAAARVASSVTSRLTAPLAGLDAAWQGADADSFLEYMRTVGLAGNDLADALGAMADALDKTADGIRQIATEMVGMLADTAEQSSDAMTVPVGGAERAQQHLDELDEPTGKLYESVRDVLDAFVKLCNGVQGGQLYGQISMAHEMPAQNWSSPAPAASPAPVAAPVASPVDSRSFSGTLPVPVGSAPVGGTSTVSDVRPLAASSSGVPPAAGAAAAGAASVPAAAQAGSVAAATHAASTAAAASTGHAAAAAAHAGSAVASGSGTQQGQPPESAAVAAPSDSPPAAVPGSAPPADSAGAGAAGGGSSGAPTGMGGMGGARGGGGGDTEHKSKIRITGDPREIFGKPDRTAPPVIGEE
jgi:uncharacterized protein YukE